MKRRYLITTVTAILASHTLAQTPNCDAIPGSIPRINWSGCDKSYNRYRMSRGNNNLSYANLHQTNFTRAEMIDTNLFYANLSSANLINTQLWQANLSHANLRRANFSGAEMHNSNLSRADMYETNFTSITRPFHTKP